VQIQLARLFPDRWAALQETDPEGELKRREQLAERIAATLRLSLRLDNVFKAFQTPADPWSASSVADLSLLSDPTRTQVITNRYREANTGADRFSLEANRRNLDIFKELGLFEPGVTAALEVIDEEIRRRAPPERQLKRALLFTGHMVDAVGRAPEKARFPRTSTAEATARQLIHDAVKKEVGADASDTLGIAGGASGGDILFHEVCAELGIETELYLALPVADFQTESVEPGGEDWVARFQAQCRKKPPRILQKSLAPPEWLASLEGYNIWERNNLDDVRRAGDWRRPADTDSAVQRGPRSGRSRRNQASADRRAQAWTEDASVGRTSAIEVIDRAVQLSSFIRSMIDWIEMPSFAPCVPATPFSLGMPSLPPL
jgi:hypothetical protein